MKSRYLLLACCLSAPLLSYPQEPKTQPFFISIIVMEIDESLEWYRDNLKLEVVSDDDFPDLGIRQANLKNQNFQLELIQSTATVYQQDILVDQSPLSHVSGLFKFGLLVDHFDEFLTQLREKGVKIHGKVVNDPVSG